MHDMHMSKRLHNDAICSLVRVSQSGPASADTQWYLHNDGAPPSRVSHADAMEQMRLHAYVVCYKKRNSVLVKCPEPHAPVPDMQLEPPLHGPYAAAARPPTDLRQPTPRQTPAPVVQPKARQHAPPPSGPTTAPGRPTEPRQQPVRHPHDTSSDRPPVWSPPNPTVPQPSSTMPHPSTSPTSSGPAQYNTAGPSAEDRNVFPPRGKHVQWHYRSPVDASRHAALRKKKGSQNWRCVRVAYMHGMTRDYMHASSL